MLTSHTLTEFLARLQISREARSRRALRAHEIEYTPILSRLIGFMAGTALGLLNGLLLIFARHATFDLHRYAASMPWKHGGPVYYANMISAAESLLVSFATLTNNIAAVSLHAMRD